MKKVFFTIILLLILGMYVSKNAYALSATPTPAVTPTRGDIQQIDDLKNRIASRVAQLNLVEKRGIIGTVTDATNSQITLTDVNGNIRFVDVDELTKFSNPNVSGTTFGISDISKNMRLGILGLYNKQSRRILARQINVLTLPNILVGAVYSIDSKNFNFYIVSEDNKQTFIDVENITKTYSYNSGASLVNAGFSKIKVEESVVIIGFPDKQAPSHIIASRIILLPDVPKNPKINYIPALNPGTSITPSTGSGRKLTPIIK
ncbi:MAG: hypothetical protein M1405_01800 [Patescibacteria group bacterium]|nr:hypothetical protein [Patescibacteria group bacterium]